MDSYHTIRASCRKNDKDHLVLLKKNKKNYRLLYVSIYICVQS